jgi:hypothetical protein
MDEEALLYTPEQKSCFGFLSIFKQVIGDQALTGEAWCGIQRKYRLPQLEKINDAFGNIEVAMRIFDRYEAETGKFSTPVQIIPPNDRHRLRVRATELIAGGVPDNGQQRKADRLLMKVARQQKVWQRFIAKYVSTDDHKIGIYQDWAKTEPPGTPRKYETLIYPHPTWNEFKNAQARNNSDVGELGRNKIGKKSTNSKRGFPSAWPRDRCLRVWLRFCDDPAFASRQTAGGYRLWLKTQEKGTAPDPRILVKPFDSSFIKLREAAADFCDGDSGQSLAREVSLFAKAGLAKQHHADRRPHPVL